MAVDPVAIFGPSRARSIDDVARAQMLPRIEGLISETFPRMVSNNASVLITGSVYYVAIPLLAGDVVTNISLAVSTTPGAGMTLSKVGLYDKTGVRLALSADQGTAWQSTGIKTAAMIAPYTVPTSDVYYAAAFGTTGTTMPTISRMSTLASGPVAAAIGTGVIPIGVQTSQADLPAPGVISVGAAPFGLWFGIS